ncbi:protein trichome birefringence-like 5 [Malania oleifera]|uniref:protein trichome birefringence-like 5 n=1 Tax=Malania oleifera TaxID=397392 RepID=UPI0025ADED78|nr:protein trichome birefringence-like 5 [Malania oleifera]
MASSPLPHKNLYAFVTFFLLLFLLSTVLFFSKRSLEPTLTLYRAVSRRRPAPPPLLSPPAPYSDLPPPESAVPVSSGDPPGEPLHSHSVTENGTRGTMFDGNGNGNVDEIVSDESAEWATDCDLYVGTWVKDDDYPKYKPGSCPYVDGAFSCQSNGRPDSEYLKWRWKPDGCDLPRFNATDFLVRLRGKKLMLVGDSMNRNQFESILCLLREGLPDVSRMYEAHGYTITKGRGYYVFKFADYNCTVEFVRSHFLVKEGTRINGQGNSNPTLSIDQIDKSASRWKRADILVFNTGHWWTHGKTARGKNYYKEGDYIYPKFDATEAYRRALKTWANWVDKNINPAKQLVFYRGYSSAHFRGGDWDSGGSCNGETVPILRGPFLQSYPLKMKIVEEVIREMEVPVKLLNVTRLTNFRKDGHPSIYGKNLSSGRRVSTRRQDCSHWCLPGIPDTWNELIYATLISQQTPSIKNP